MVIMSYCGVKLLRIGKNINLKSSNDIFIYLFGNRIGSIFKIIIPVFCLSSFIVMISGAGSTINQYYGINRNLGGFVLALICLISVMLGMDKLIDILGKIGPIMIVIAITISIITITKNYENLKEVPRLLSTIEMTKAVDNWSISSIVYSGLNIIFLTPFLVGAGKTIKNQKTCTYAGILGGVAFMIAAMFINFAMLSDLQNIYTQEIPTLYMAQNIAPTMGIIFSIILIAEIYTTAAPLLWNVCSSCSQEGTKEFNVLAVLCTILGFFGGMLPFSYLVNFMYPISGCLGILIIISILIKMK